MKKNTKTTTAANRPCYIYARYYYYAGTLNAPQDGALRDYTGMGDIMYFESHAAAEKYLREELGCQSYKETSTGFRRFAKDGTYVCTHGEYERPDYRIIACR